MVAEFLLGFNQPVKLGPAPGVAVRVGVNVKVGGNVLVAVAVTVGERGVEVAVKTGVGEPPPYVTLTAIQSSEKSRVGSLDESRTRTWKLVFASSPVTQLCPHKSVELPRR